MLSSGSGRSTLPGLHNRSSSRGEEALTGLAGASGAPEPGPTELAIVWYELGLLADSRYPIGSGASDERLFRGSRSGSGNRAGSPGAGSDPLAAVIGMLGSDEVVPILGLQIVMAARQLGHSLPSTTTGGLWQWTKRAKETSVAPRRQIA